MIEPIKGEKVLYSSGRIICNGRRIKFDELKAVIETYLYNIDKLKNIKGFLIDYEKLNSGISIELFEMECSIDELFQLYNDIAEIKGVKTYSKLWYNPKQSTKSCPSKLN